MKTSNSFSSRLSLYVIVITAILFIVAMYLVAGRSRTIITNSARQNAKNMLDAKIGDIEKVISNVEAAVQNSVWVIREHRNDPDYMYRVTEELVRDNKNIMGSAVAFQPNYFKEKGLYYSPYSYYNEDSTLISFQLGNDSYDYPEREWFKVSALEKKPHWCEPYYDEGGGREMMTTFSVPVIDSLGNVFAVVTADVNLANLTSIINSDNDDDENIVALISKQGKFVAYPDSSFIMKETINSVVDKYMVGASNFMDNILSGDEGMEEFYYEGTRCFCIYGSVSNNWSAYILCSYDEILKDLNSMNLLFQLVVIIGLILLYICSRSAIKKISLPISQFSDYALQIKDGNLNAQLPEIDSNDELKTLHDSLHDMQVSLKQLETTTKAKQRFESELNIARKIQLGMVPKDFPAFVSAIMYPAKEVGGDFYDFIIKDEFLYFAVGDVTGKGVPAALFMSLTRSAFRFVSALNLSIEEIVSRINNSVCDGNSTSMFVTLFVGKLNLNTGHLEYCNAGHNPIIIVPPSGKAHFLSEEPNLAAGLLEEYVYKGQYTDIEPGTRIILYTDGVTEAEKADKELYGNRRLIEFAESTRSLTSPKHVAEDLLKSVRAFTNGTEQNDDITIMTIDYGKNI